MTLRRTAFDMPEVQAFLENLPAGEDRARRLQALTDARDALIAARARDGELVTEIDANTHALLDATGKQREQLLIERARHAAERDALPSMIEIRARRYTEALVAACQLVHGVAVTVHDEADAALASRSRERTHIVSALTRFESESRYQQKADAKREDLRTLDRELQPSRTRREQARQVLNFVDLTLTYILGEGHHTGAGQIERFVQRSIRKVA